MHVPSLWLYTTKACHNIVTNLILNNEIFLREILTSLFEILSFGQQSFKVISGDLEENNQTLSLVGQQ